MWSKYRQLLTRAHQSNQQKEIFLTWTTAICVTFALYLSVWMRFADFGDGGSSSSSGRLVSEGFSAGAASWWCCQLASVVVLLSVDIVVSNDDRLCCLSEDDTLTLPETRMNSGGRDDLPVTGCAFPTTTTATGTTTNTSLATASSRPRPSPSSSRVVWHSVDTSPPPPLQQQQQTRLGRLYDLRVESPAAATPFRSPMSPLKTAGSSASVYLPFGQMAAHAAAAAAALYPPLLPLGRPGFMSGGGGGFFPRLPPLHPPPPQPMTSGLQQPYLTNLNEPYGQSSLIQISQLPPPPPPHPRRPLPIQYPSFLGRLSSSSSLDGDSITGSHVISLHHHQQQSPSPSLHRMTSAFDPFQRSPMPEPPAQVQRSPVQVHFSDERSQFDRRTQRRGGGGGGGGGGVTVAPSRSIPHLSTPPSLAARHQGRPSTLTAEIRTPTTSAASRSVQRPEADTSGRPRAEQDPRRGTARPSSSPPSGAIEVGAPPPPPPVPPATATCLQPQHPHYPAHFVRGSIIQLSSGQLKRIEDLRTTDFVDSAGISDDLRIDSSTVIHMRQNHERNTVVLGFSVGQQNIQVTVEATLEHPFFVYNQGWSSYSPELTRRRFGLNCHQLNVGNCCISLTQRPPPPPQPAVPPAAQSLRRHRRRPVSSSSPSHAPDPRRGDAGESGREEEEEEEEENEEEEVVGERHCLSSHGRRFVPGFSGFATHSIGSASLGGPPTTVRSTEVPSAPSAALSGATQAGRKRRWSAPDVLHHHNHPGHHHHHHQHHHRHRHHRENIPRSSLGEVSEEGGTGRGTSSSPPPPSFQLPSTES